MYLNVHTKRVQSNLANYCRTGALNKISGANPGRVKHYRRLVYNIINESLQSAYPLTFQLLNDLEWEEQVNEFFTNHPCQSPQVWGMPKEFYEYVVEHNHAIIRKYPFLPNLLEMEWLEVELFMMEDITVDYKRSGQSSDDELVLNPEHRLVRFDYPVHLKKGFDIVLSDKGHYFLVMHREPDTGKVLFMDISVFFARLIENLKPGPLSFNSLVQLTTHEFGFAADDRAYKESKTFINKAINNKLILHFIN